MRFVPDRFLTVPRTDFFFIVETASLKSGCGTCKTFRGLPLSFNLSTAFEIFWRFLSTSVAVFFVAESICYKYHKEYTCQEPAFFILISSSLTAFTSSTLSIPSISPNLLFVILSIWLRMILVKRGLSSEIFVT